VLRRSRAPGWVVDSGRAASAGVSDPDPAAALAPA